MSKMQIPKKIRSEDFPSDEQESISKIGLVYNNFADEVYSILNGRVDFDNLSRKLVDVLIVIDSTGKLINPPQIKLDLANRVRGTNVVRAINQVNPTIYPTNAPFVSFDATSTILTITNVTGLQNGSQYLLTIELL